MLSLHQSASSAGSEVISCRPVRFSDTFQGAVIDENGALVERLLEGETVVSVEEPAGLSLHPQQIPHTLPWD
jgi:hypothetical protein